MAKLSAFEFVGRKRLSPKGGFCVLEGTEPFLRSLALERLRKLFADDEDDCDIRRFDGKSAELRDVIGEVATRSMFGDTRVVMIDDANAFLKNFRDKLETFLETPPSSGFLILSVQSWPKNTRLAKLAEKHGAWVIDCTPPKPQSLIDTLTKWSEARYGVALKHDAAELLVDLLGPNPGVLDQELAKLANVVSPGKPITVTIVEENVSAWHAKAVWDMLDAALDGKPQDALVMLDRLINSGENPVGIFGMIAPTLRRYATAAHILLHPRGRPVPIPAALEQAGFRKFTLRSAEARLKRLGRYRTAQLVRWLNEADLAMKGARPSDPRWILERLLWLIGSPDAVRVEARLL
ncbi:MAG: DNA polymerase III subunit delta [Planctomycetota bacterium]|nr:MAG: DNA polymerase III subunit delta [Planctomycetota bacterium]